MVDGKRDMQLYLGTLTRYYTSVKPLDEADPEVVAGAVSAWRHWLNKELPYALDWDESPTAPFDSTDVGEKDIAALRVLATSEISKLPPRVPDSWQHEAGIGDYPQVTQPTLWLPGANELLFQARELSEDMTWVGSSVQLLSQLEAMRYQWKHDLREHAEFAERLERIGKMLGRMARRSIEYRLPLRLIPE